MATPTVQYTDKEYLVLEKEQATAWAERDSTATAIGIPLSDGDYGVVQTDPFREQNHTTGDAYATYLEQDERTLGGSIPIPLFPASCKEVLDWGAARTSDELDSYTATLVSPDIESARHFGLKVGSMRIEASAKGDVVARFETIGRYEAKLGSDPASPTMPSVNAYTFAQGRLLLSIDDGSTEIEPVSVESWSIELQNNLDAGPPKEDRADSDKSMSISYLMAGKPSISASITALWDRDDYGDMCRGKLQGSFRVVLAHKSGGATATTDTANLGSSVSVAVTSSADFAVNEVVRFESSAGVVTQGGLIEAIADGTHITIATLEKNVASGDLVYGKALQLYVPTLYADGCPKRRGKSQIVRVTLNLKGFADPGDDLFTYIADATT